MKREKISEINKRINESKEKENLEYGGKRKNGEKKWKSYVRKYEWRKIKDRGGGGEGEEYGGKEKWREEMEKL